MKKCPYCAEEIQDEAIVCRYCGRDLDTEFPQEDLKKCPYCAEWIPVDAEICSYCELEIQDALLLKERKMCPHCLEWIESEVDKCPLCNENLSVQDSIVAPKEGESDSDYPQISEHIIQDIRDELLEMIDDEQPFRRKFAAGMLRHFINIDREVQIILKEVAESDTKSYVRDEAERSLSFYANRDKLINKINVVSEPISTTPSTHEKDEEDKRRENIIIGCTLLWFSFFLILLIITFVGAL